MRFTIAIVLMISIFSSCKSDLKEHLITGEAQGTTYAIKYISSDSKITKNSIDSILDLFDNSLSTYKENSIISKFNHSDEEFIYYPWQDDLFVESPFDIDNGHATVTDAPGWGVEIRPEWLAQSRYQITSV